MRPRDAKQRLELFERDSFECRFCSQDDHDAEYAAGVQS
jgi:hypothetical protein